MPLRKLPILGRVDTRKRLLRSWQGLGRAMVLSRMRNHPRTHHRALACTQSQGRGCQRASDICMGRSGAVEAPTRSTNVTLRLHVGTSRTSFRSRISAHGGQGGRGREIHISRHSHMLRHACGFKLANDGHDTRTIQAYLGHRSIMSTVRYTALTPNRFKNFWKDYTMNVVSGASPRTSALPPIPDIFAGSHRLGVVSGRVTASS